MMMTRAWSYCVALALISAVLVASAQDSRDAPELVRQRVKAMAAQALEHVGADAVIAIPDLTRLLEDPSEGLRNSACIALAGIGPAARDALPALRRALSDPGNDVRRFAQCAIERIAPKHD